MFKSLGLTGNIAKKDLPVVAGKICEWCRKKDIQIYVDESLYPLLKVGKKSPPKITKGDFSECDLLCAMGGDGFFLHAIRTLYPTDIPILPVNLGSLGFTAQTLPGEITTVLNQILKNKIQITKRYLLKIGVSENTSGAPPMVALNDVLLIKETRSRLIHVEVCIDGRILGEVSCDGMVVSTATGSTAYNLSAGGPIVHPTLPAIIIAPLLPHTISSRPVIIPDNMIVELKLVSHKDREDALFCIDGQYWWKALSGESVQISLAQKPIKIVEPYSERYFEKLRRNLKWGISPRVIEEII